MLALKETEKMILNAGCCERVKLLALHNIKRVSATATETEVTTTATALVTAAAVAVAVAVSSSMGY